MTDSRSIRDNFDTIVILLLLIGSSTVNSKPILAEKTNAILPSKLKFAATYLHRYGYIESPPSKAENHEILNGLEKFANEMHIGSFTGQPSELTKLISLMNLPRCSKIEQLERRQKRFGKNLNCPQATTMDNKYISVANRHKWIFTDLTWTFRDPYNLFKRYNDFKIVRNTISHALDMWSRASQGVLRFTEASNRNTTTLFPNMDVFFARGDHGDYEPFDGRGGIVAHSGYPMEGKVHFDASELWTIKGSKGIDVRYVMLHELGHALGLRHSKHKSAIMHPIYRNTPKDLELSDDDIKGIQYLYRRKLSKHDLLKRRYFWKKE